MWVSPLGLGFYSKLVRLKVLKTALEKAIAAGGFYSKLVRLKGEFFY